MEEFVGIVRGEASFTSYEFSINPSANVSFGEFVVTKNRDGDLVLGTVRHVKNVNWLLSSVKSNFNSLALDIEEYGESLGENEEVVATVRILGKIEGNELVPNRVPIRNGEYVYKASDDLLQMIYGNDGIEIGTLLLRPNVRIKLDVNELVSRHFAVLAVTGAGKSNAVAVIIKGIVEDVGGTVVVLDPHGDYVNLRLPETGIDLVNIIDGKIRIEDLDPEELADLIGISSSAQIQRHFLSLAWETVKHKNQSLGGESLLEALLDLLNEWISRKTIKYWSEKEGRMKSEDLKSERIETIRGIIFRIRRFLRNYGNIVTSENLVAAIKPGMVNVIDLSPLDENQMKVVVGKFLEAVFEKRVEYEMARKRFEKETSKKKRDEYEEIMTEIESKYPALAYPILVIVEEAHIFAPQGEENDAMRIMGRIAREGRKFGVGLGVVSQRPSKLNEDILSQMNTKIILRIVNPRDQEYVLKASEQLSKDLMDDIAGLGKGEAVIVGQAIKLPALVRIYNFKELRGKAGTGQYGGEDIGILDRWNKMKRNMVNSLDIDIDF
ncbi:MAG: double-strand break repair helicase HerA and related ATPase [Pyrococcus sp.]|uniref:DNA double-strand break repair helicase HerA n=1 Tax=Pyrococcus sp. TaxID=33866 RepID=UPI00258FD147|nr:DNA double-strand break repair helicase HerA [Pyrococcus sp.]MDK2869313.1 double-strand break repair helicase HerA and related ATPase [Pyrococcus sp.]